MLQIYPSPVCSKVDYGSFVYGSAMESKLSIVDPVHYTGIHLATGMFSASLLKSLLAESGEPPFFLWRNPLFCGYIAKLVTTASPVTWCSIPSNFLQQV